MVLKAISVLMCQQVSECETRFWSSWKIRALLTVEGRNQMLAVVQPTTKEMVTIVDK
jgi:hypothetical protein